MKKSFLLLLLFLFMTSLAWAAGGANNVTRQLTSGTVQSWQGAWSPNGQWIAYHKGDGDAADNTDNGCIYKVKSDGTAVTKLTDGWHCDSKPNWSPDGRWIVFQRYDQPAGYTSGGNYASVWKMKANGTGQTKLVSAELVDTDGDGLDEQGRGAQWPVWSPDGYWIAFRRGSPSGVEMSSLRVVRPNGAGEKALTNPDYNYASVFGWGPNNFDIRWKPAGLGLGRKLAVSLINPIWYYDMSNDRGLALVDRVRPAANRWLTNGWGYSCQSQLAWSPNGRRIAYKDDTLGNGDIWVMNAGGTGKVRLTNTIQDEADNPGYSYCYSMPAWHRSGRFLAIYSSRFGPMSTDRWVQVMSLDGTRVSVTPNIWADDGTFGGSNRGESNGVDLAFNRAGTKILFGAEDPAYRTQLWIVDLDTGDADHDGIPNWQEDLQ